MRKKPDDSSRSHVDIIQQTAIISPPVLHDESQFAAHSWDQTPASGRMTVYFHRLSCHLSPCVAPGQTLSWLIISGQHFAAPVANLILVFALRICCLHARATHRFFFFNKPDKVWGFRQTVGRHISLSTHQRPTGFHRAHLQGHQCYQGESEASSPHRCTHTYTQVGNYSIGFMSTRSRKNFQQWVTPGKVQYH